MKPSEKREMHGIYLETLRTGLIKITGEENHHLRVKRIKAGEKVFLTDGRGNVCIATVEKLGKTESFINCDEIKRQRKEKSLAIFLSFIDQDKIEIALEKSTELGLSYFFLFPSRRSQGKKIKIQRLKKKAIQAIKQSNNPFLPEISILESMEEAIKKANEFQGTFFLQKGQERIRTFPDMSAFFIGPEGGWAEEELDLFRENGFTGIGLGDTILRSETAVISISSLFMLI